MKKVIVSILLLVFLLGGIIGCKNNQITNPNSNPVVDSFVENNEQIEEGVTEVGENIEQETEIIEGETTSIDENIQIIQQNSDSLESNFNELQNIVPELMLLSNNDEEIMSLIYRSIDAIRASANNIEQSNESITQSNEAIQSERQELLRILRDIQNNNQRAERIQAEMQQKDEVIADRDARIDELEDDLESSSTQYLGLLIGFGALMMVLGVLGFFYNFKVGIALLGIGGITVAMSAAVMYYMGIFAIIGLCIAGGGLVLMLAYLAWLLFRGRRWAQSTEENTELLEVVKQELPQEKRREIFGDRIRPGLADQLQSPFTKKAVDKIRRTKLKPKMESTIAHPNPHGDLVVRDGAVYQKVDIDPSALDIKND